MIRRCIHHYGIDLAELQHLNTAAYLPFAARVPVVLREHNVEYKVWERHAEHARSALERLYVRSCAPRVRAYEARMAERFSRCITVSRADEAHLRAAAPTARIKPYPPASTPNIFFLWPSPKFPIRWSSPEVLRGRRSSIICVCDP